MLHFSPMSSCDYSGTHDLLPTLLQPLLLSGVHIEVCATPYFVTAASTIVFEWWSNTTYILQDKAYHCWNTGKQTTYSRCEVAIPSTGWLVGKTVVTSILHVWSI